MTWIVTYTGKRFYPLAPRAEDVDIRDIAHALSLTCRFSGHTPWLYSVAQHSVLCATLVPQELRIHALLHDAAEAYLFDAARPIKGRIYLDASGNADTLDSLDDMVDVEETIDCAVYEALGIDNIRADDWLHVLRADAEMLSAEADRFFSPREDWMLTAPPADVRIVQAEPAETERSFLRAFADYMGLR